MCGIAGVYSFNQPEEKTAIEVKKAVEAIKHRGPDNQETIQLGNATFGHARLSVIDPDPRANQPFMDPTGRYMLTYNGEIYNYKELKNELPDTNFLTNSDTEVLLHLLIQFGEAALEKLDGFFAFAFYDSQTNTLLLARDRMGIKPIYYCHTQNHLYFCSEMGGLMKFSVPKEINNQALLRYLQLNYIPAPLSIIDGIEKLEPGHYVTVIGDQVEVHRYHNIPFTSGNYTITDYESAKAQLVKLLNQSVENRMIADVPLGTFLSGGLDSSVISAIAASKTDHLHTFSIGYKDHPFFDETEYAISVAKKIGSEHTVFDLTTTDLYQQLDKVLASTTEPFADSSAIAVNILAERTKQHVTVALSGDGADELFGGYNKHIAEWNVRQGNWKNTMIKAGAPIWRGLPKSRSSKTSNLVRQLDKYATSIKLDAKQRYWNWATFIQDEALDLVATHDNSREYELLHVANTGDLNDVLRQDCGLVLPNDMLAKVDLMSMAHALEVRTPFLDHKVVEFAFSIPPEFKINKSGRKMILQNSFCQHLPPELYNRPKKGFEVPMLDWLTSAMKTEIETNYLNRDKITEQGIFNPHATERLKERLFSRNPQDAHATVWAIIVFQHWYENVFIE